MYADESGLLVFAAPLTSASFSKKSFLKSWDAIIAFGIDGVRLL